VKEVGFEPIVLQSFPIRWFTQTSQWGCRISADWRSSTSQKVGLPTHRTQIDLSTERWNRIRIFDLWPDPTWSL